MLANAAFTCLMDPENDYVCKKENGGRCTPSVIKYNTIKISKKLNICFSKHSLRHTHVSNSFNPKRYICYNSRKKIRT